MDPDLIKFGLDAPQSYRDATEEERNEAYNGCGAEWMSPKIRKHLDRITIYMKETVRIHDWEYGEKEKSPEKKKDADDRLYANGRKQIAYYFKWYLQPKQYLKYRIILRAMYIAVQKGGDTAYYGESK
jgi:hypothetical protein